jgi:hypothetical protein
MLPLTPSLTKLRVPFCCVAVRHHAYSNFISGTLGWRLYVLFWCEMDLGQKPRSYCPCVLYPGGSTHSRKSWGLTRGIDKVMDTDWPTLLIDHFYPTIEFQDQYYFRKDHALVTLHFVFMQSILQGSVEASAMRKASLLIRHYLLPPLTPSQ